MRHNSLVVTILVGIPLTVLSAGPVKLSGSANLYGEYGWVSGDSLVTPRPELRFNLTPSLSFWGCPLSLDILLSTQENNLRQQLDKYRFFLHPSEWLSGMANPPNFALAIKGVELGSCNPSWSPYTLSGTPLLGGAFELNPWYVYLAGAAGRTQRAVQVSDSTDGAYSRMLYSGKFGFGKKERTHFYLTGLYTTEDTASLRNNMRPYPDDTVPPPDSFEVVRPKENYVLGAEFNLNLWKGAFTLASEVTGSELTRDKRMPVADSFLPKSVPRWVTNTFKPRFSSSFDYAWKVRPALNVLETKLNGQFEFVGPGYQSLGAPNLRNDNLTLGGGIERDFFDRSVSLSASYSTERDNLLAVKDDSGRVLRLKSRTTRFTSWDASLGLSFPNLPYLQATYSPYSERDDSSSSFANVVSVSAGHSFQTGTLSHSPGVTVSYSDLRGKSDATGDYTSWDAGLNYGLGFSFPLSLAASCGYSRSVAAGVPAPDERLYFDLTPSYTAFKIWRNSLSLGGTFGSSTRGDVRLTSSVPVWKVCDASVMVADAVYRGADGRYNDLRLTATLSKSW
jgi:hypothetical protein